MQRRSAKFQFYMQLVYKSHFGTYMIFSAWTVWAAQGSIEEKNENFDQL